jgi:galactoside O-acetyltransferase
MNSFYSKNELDKIGFRKVGDNVLISRFARFYSPEKMQIGSNVRIDDFCILSGDIILHDFIHISAFCALYGKFGIEIDDYSGLSPRSTVFSATDDFSGDFLVGPMVDSGLTNVKGGKVIINKYCQVGAGSVVLPDITIREGVAVGAMSLVNKTLDEWSVFAGIPCKFVKKRTKKLLDLI